jgi:three-Cys-motif partner protein
VRSFDLYKGREATWVKHLVLEKYLEKLAYKIGGWCATMNYVDGFAGPWHARDEQLADTPPHIAIARLRVVRDGLATRGSTPTVRCLFVEKDSSAVEKLKASVRDITDISIEVLHGEFEQHVPDVVRFASEGPRNFGFFFIDPTGWTGFGMNAIRSVLRHRPGEVLINFMTKDIKRFIDDPDSAALPTFVDLFGHEYYRDQWRGLTGQDREDVIVQAYCERVQEVGQFNHVVSAVVLHPTDERTHFHLVYGTRHREGLRVFRDVEKETMATQERVRATAKQRERIERTQQLEIFAADEVEREGHYQRLRERYLASSRAVVLEALTKRGTISFDDLEEIALAMPMTWTSDLKEWLQEWRGQGRVRLEGLAAKARVPQRDQNHRVVWLA